MIYNTLQSPHEKLKFKLQLIHEDKRLETFKQWPFPDDKPCSARKMAEAGFYFTGSVVDPDSVQCFFCDKALDGWEEQDDPWTEHFQHSKGCRFAQLKQPEAALTVEQLTNFKVDYVKKEFQKSAKEVYGVIEEEYNERLLKIKRNIRAFKK